MPMHFGNVLRPSSRRDAAAGLNTHVESTTANQSQPRPAFRRIVGYHNAVCDETCDPAERPPTYTQSTLSTQNLRNYSDSLPQYSSSVNLKGVVEIKMERNSPFEIVQHSMWMEVFARLQGTLLEIHHVKTPGGLFGSSSRHENMEPSAGRSIRKYTLQHAEVGVASDHKKVELVPRSPIATILPESVLQRLKQTEPHLFDEVHHYVARLRLEGDQFLMRFKSADDRSKWVNQLCAAIDIAPPLEVRSEPRYHTLPRRRRRHHGRSRRAGADAHVQIDSLALAQEQQRIAGEQFPNLLPGHSEEADNVPETPLCAQFDTGGDQEGGEENDTSRDQAANNSDPEADDLDMEFMDREPARRNLQCLDDHADRMARTRMNSSRGTTINDSFSDPNFTKQTLRVPVDPVREARYRRRCMPMLVYNSRHANEIIIRKGKALRIDWEKKALKPYAFRPPSYDSCCNTANRETTMAFFKSLQFGKPKASADRETRPNAPDQNMESSLSASSTAENIDGSCDEEVAPQRKNSWATRLRKVASRRDLTPIDVPPPSSDEPELPFEPMMSPSFESGPIYNVTTVDDRILRRMGF